jgi:transcriptional regulator with GAF, ATPase, and Fis domain
MVSQADVGRTVDKILGTAAALTPAAEVGVFRLHDERRVEIAGTSGARARRADELQLDYGEGPCLSAALGRKVCLLNDTHDDDRWTRWSATVAELGWRSVLSLPLALREAGIGALNLYATQPRSFRDEDVERAQVFARHASVALGVRITEERLKQAMADQHVLGQAKGILMERYGLSRERAQTVIEQHATTTGLLLSEVSQLIIETRRLPTKSERLG